MHIYKSPRRKIARKCIFCAGVPAYARIRAGATALKSNSASYNFSAERSLMPGIALQYLRREPARREGACRSTKDANTKKAAGSHDSTAFEQNFCNLCTLFPIYALPEYHKPADAYTCYYVEHQGYTDVQSYAVEPRHVTFGWKLHKHLFVLIDGVGGCNCSIAP